MVKPETSMRHRPLSERLRTIRRNNLNAFVTMGRKNPRLGFRKLVSRFENQPRIILCPKTVHMALKRQGYILNNPIRTVQ